MGLFSDLVGKVLGGYAQKPKVPTYQPVSAGGSAATAVSANTANLPGIENLSSQYNLFNQQQLTQMLNTAIPGYDQIASKASSNILDELSGKLPADVLATIQSSDASKALAGGFGGSGLASNLTARDLGLTSLNLTQQGLSSAESWTSMMDRMFAPGQFNASSMFISPATQIAVNTSNTENQWGVDWLKNQINAMPNPANAAIAGDLGQIADFTGSGILNALVPGLGNIPGLGSGGGGMGGGGGNPFSSIMSSIGGMFGGGSADAYAGTGFAAGGDLAGLVGLVG